MSVVEGDDFKAKIKNYSVKYKNNVDFRRYRVFNGQL